MSNNTAKTAPYFKLEKLTGVGDKITEQSEELKIWQSFLNGDESAFIWIYKTYFQVLIKYGLQFFDQVSDAEDFVQDLFIDLRLKRKRLKYLKSSVKAYLLVSLKNRILDYKAKEIVHSKRMENYFENFEFVFPVEDEIIRTQEYNQKILKLKNALSKLSVRQREAIYYLYFENLSYAEIKDIMGIDQVKSVRNLVYKAFDKIKPILQMVIGLSWPTWG